MANSPNEGEQPRFKCLHTEDRKEHEKQHSTVAKSLTLATSTSTKTTAPLPKNI